MYFVVSQCLCLFRPPPFPLGCGSERHGTECGSADDSFSYVSVRFGAGTVCLVAMQDQWIDSMVCLLVCLLVRSVCLLSCPRHQKRRSLCLVPGLVRPVMCQLEAAMLWCRCLGVRLSRPSTVT